MLWGWPRSVPDLWPILLKAEMDQMLKQDVFNYFKGYFEEKLAFNLMFLESRELWKLSMRLKVENASNPVMVSNLLASWFPYAYL